MPLKRDTDTGLILRKSGGGLCRTCCGSEPQYAAGTGCCCFLDPNPEEWSPIKLYNAGQAVRYNSKNYFSLFNGNIGRTPGSDPWWFYYQDCGNEDWDSCPPYGGVGKTPLWYHISHTFESDVYEQIQIEADLLHVGDRECDDLSGERAECICFSNCAWVGNKEVTLTRKSDQSQVNSNVLYIVRFRFYYSGVYRTVIYSSLYYLSDTVEICSRDPLYVLLFDDCMLSGSHVNGLQTLSWSPKV